MDTMNSTKEEEAVMRRLEQLELAGKAREAEEFLERVEEVHATVKGLIDGTIDAAELEKQQQREVLRKRAKEIRKEEAAARARDELRMGRAGKGEGKRPYTYFCRFCLVEYEVEDLRCCNRCGRQLQTREQRVAELQQRVQELKGEKQQHASRKARWRRWLQTKKILKSSRLVVDYAAWERWEPSTDEDEKQNEPPVTPNDANFHALEQDLQATARSRAGKRAAALRCKERGNKLFKSGDWLGALQAYEEGLEHARDVKELWTNKCLVLLKMQQYEEANRAATRLLEYCEIFEDGYTESADVCFKAFARRALANRALRRFDDALADLQQAAELQPDDKQVRQLLQQTQQQVEQLQQLKQLQRLSEGAHCEEEKERLNSQGQRNEIPATQQAPSTTGVEGVRRLRHPTEGQREAATQRAEGAVSLIAEAAAARSFENSSTTATSAAREAPLTVDPTEAYVAPSAAAGEGPEPIKAAEAGAWEEKSTAATEKVTAHPRIHKGESNNFVSEPQCKCNGRPQVGEEPLLHVAGSNQPTSAATPASPPSPHGNSKEESGGESLFAAASGPLCPSSTSVEQATGAAGKSVTSAVQETAPSTSDTGSLSRGLHVPIKPTAAAAAVADTSAPTGAASLHDFQVPTKEANRRYAVHPSPPRPLVAATPASSPVKANNAAEALKQLKRVLYPAAVAGSFVAIDPPSLTAALQLLKFPPVKLAFCCSALPQITVGNNNESSHYGTNSTSSSISCSSETPQQRRQGASSPGDKEHRSDSEEKQEGRTGSKSEVGEVLQVHETFLDICIADLRTGALRVRRQRREKAETSAATSQTSYQGAEGSASCKALPCTFYEKAGTQSSSVTKTDLDLYPHACFPALQLLHSVCFVEERIDGTRGSDEERRSTVECCNNSDKAEGTGSTAGGSQMNCKTIHNCTASDTVPSWLLEVCEAAAPYLLTIISELLHLLVLNSRSAVPNTGTTSAATADLERSSYCGCHAAYKVVSHLDYHKSTDSCGACPLANTNTTADGETVSKDAPYCCVWGACVAALATSMSLLQQMSVSPLTRKKLAEQLQRNSDGRAVLLGIPPLLLCCTHGATAAVAAAPAPGAVRWQSWRPAGEADAPEGVSASASACLPVRSSDVLHDNRQKGPQRLAAAALAEKRLQQARRDAGAVLCNLLLEQPVLQQLLPQRHADRKCGKDQLPQSVESTKQPLGNNTQQQRLSSKMPSHLEDNGKEAGVGMQGVLQDLLRGRLQAVLQREQLLQQTEEATAALCDQLDRGARPLELLASLWKQAVSVQQQQQQRGSSTNSRRMHQEKLCPVNFTVARSLRESASPLPSSDRKSRTDISTRAVGRDCLSVRQSHEPGAASHTDDIITKLLLSMEKLDEIEAEANTRATTTDGTVEDPLLEEAQQALDIITNLGRSSVGRVFVLKHLQQELLQLLAISSAAAAKGKERDGHVDRLSRAVSVIQNSHQHRLQQQQLEAVELLRELLTPPGGSRSRGTGRFVQADDVLGLMLNLTASSAISAVSSRSSSATEAQGQQDSSTRAAELTSLQQQLLLSGGTHLGVLPLLLPFIDKLTEDHQAIYCAGQGAAVQAAAHTSLKVELTPPFRAALRSLTVVSRVVAAAGAVAGQAVVTAGASTAAVSTAEGSAPQQQQDLQKRLLLRPSSRFSLQTTAAAAMQQKHVLPGMASEQNVEMKSMATTQHRDFVNCLLPRILKLLTPPDKRQQPRRESRPEQQQRPGLPQQASTDQDGAPWGELQNAALLVLCALANLNVSCLLETAATTTAPPLGAYSRTTAAAASSESPSSGGSTSMQEQAQQQTQQQDMQRRKDKLQQKEEHGNSQGSALQELGRIICGWLQLLKPRSYAHQRTEMRDPVAMARGNFLLLLGHLAKAQGAALQKQLSNEQQQHQGSAGARHVQREAEQAQQQQRSQTELDATSGARGREGEEHAAATPGAVARNVAEETGALPIELLQQELTKLDLRSCVHCCVESLRKDVEGPQKNAAIALAALARIAKYRPHIEALNGFESLMQIAAPRLLGKR